MNARFQLLLDGDAEILPRLSVIATPGHTAGHQCVLVQSGKGRELLIGDGSYTPRKYLEPDSGALPDGQASDVAAWHGSVRRIKSVRPDRVHFCHNTEVLHS